MGRLTTDKILQTNILRCPQCWGFYHSETKADAEWLNCQACQGSYPVIDGSPLLLPSSSRSNPTKQDIQTFWRELYRKAYSDHDQEMSQEEFHHLLLDLEKLFKHREHLATTEMPVDHLQGKRILEIGSGAGAHSAFLASKGAHVVALDLTLDRVVATARKLDRILSNQENFCIQGEAEKLPFADNSFDIVYSNGVLHHTPRTQQAVEEVYRVLKPGGKAVIMLYAKNSFYYWFTIFFLKGLLMGNYFRSKNWLGSVTEWMPKKRQKVFNPETKVYSGREIRQLFQDFHDIQIRKNSFTIQQVPVLGKILSRLIGRFTGYNPAGTLLYGTPWRNEAQWELTVGRYLGFGLNILALK